MSFKPYQCIEILDYFERIDCLADVQIIADYLNENERDYTPGEVIMLFRILAFYAEVFVL